MGRPKFHSPPRPLLFVPQRYYIHSSSSFMASNTLETPVSHQLDPQRPLTADLDVDGLVDRLAREILSKHKKWVSNSLTSCSKGEGTCLTPSLLPTVTLRLRVSLSVSHLEALTRRHLVRPT